MSHPATETKVDFLERIRDIPQEGFWKVSTESTFLMAAQDLKRRGMTEDEVVHFLGGLYSATCHEFGA